MNREQFARKVAKKTDVSICEARFWVENMFDILTEEIMINEKVTIMNFGTFKRKFRKECNRINISTKEMSVSPAKTAVVFKPSVYLSNKIAEEAPLKEG